MTTGTHRTILTRAMAKGPRDQSLSWPKQFDLDVKINGKGGLDGRAGWVLSETVVRVPCPAALLAELRLPAPFKIS